jgi:subtilisin-like proprotein convertase family protein
MIMNRMKGLVLLTSALLVLSQTMAQSYTGGGMSIPDHGAAINIPLNISGLDSAQINANYGLERVCININHMADQDLAIYLMSPDGTSVELTSGIGGSGDNYSNTCFDMSASTLITLGTPPFTGSFVPRHSIGIVNNGSNGNGTWRLVVIDYIAGDTGSVIDWSLEFGYSPPPPMSISIGPCDDYHPAACVCPDAALSCWLKPDMFVASSMLADTLIWQHESFRRLQVTNSCANIGFGPMELIGTGLWFCGDSLVSGPGLCPDSTYRKQQVKQRVYIKRDGLAYFDYIDTIVGLMQFHSALGHNHLHIDDWAQNSIRLRGPETDPSQWPVVGTGQKVSFCLYDHLECGTSFRNCEYDTSLYLYADIHNNGLGAGYATCGASVQGISVGYSDVYDWMLEGQDIHFDTICNGDYYLVSEFDPTHRFVDNDRSNNVTVVPVHLRQQIANCCKTNFRIDTLSYAENRYRFVDVSMPIPNRWFWDFGNGSTDTTQFPTIDFNDSAVLHVQLQTWNNAGCNDSLSKTISTHVDFSDTCHFRIFTFPINDWQAEIVLIDSATISHFSIDFPTASRIDSISNYRFWVYDRTCAFCADTATLHATDSFGCHKDIVFAYEVAWEGIEEMAAVNNIKLYPNPAVQQSELSFNIHRNSDVEITLMDCLGRNIQTVNKVKKHIVGEYHYRIDLPSKGVYFLRCRFDNTEQTFKLIGY